MRIANAVSGSYKIRLKCDDYVFSDDIRIVSNVEKISIFRNGVSVDSIFTDDGYYIQGLSAADQGYNFTVHVTGPGGADMPFVDVFIVDDKHGMAEHGNSAFFPATILRGNIAVTDENGYASFPDLTVVSHASRHARFGVIVGDYIETNYNLKYRDYLKLRTPVGTPPPALHIDMPTSIDDAYDTFTVTATIASATGNPYEPLSGRYVFARILSVNDEAAYHANDDELTVMDTPYRYKKLLGPVSPPTNDDGTVTWTMALSKGSIPGDYSILFTCDYDGIDEMAGVVKVISVPNESLYIETNDEVYEDVPYYAYVTNDQGEPMPGKLPQVTCECTTAACNGCSVKIGWGHQHTDEV